MAKKEYPSHIKCCATCQFWAGAREARKGTSGVIVDPMTKGKCGAGTFPSYTQPAATYTGCMKYKKWDAMK